MDWETLYFEAVFALMAMECRAERAEAAAKSGNLGSSWKVNPELMLVAKFQESERRQRQ